MKNTNRVRYPVPPRDPAQREAAQIEAAATGRPIDPSLIAAAIPGEPAPPGGGGALVLVTREGRPRPGIQETHDELASSLTEIIDQICRGARGLSPIQLLRAANALHDAAPYMREHARGRWAAAMRGIVTAHLGLPADGAGE